MAKLSIAMSDTLLSIALNGERIGGISTLKALERRGLITSEPHPRYPGVNYYDNLTISKSGWVLVGEVAQKYFDLISDFSQRNLYHPKKRIERGARHIENMQRWGALIARAEWHAS